MQISVIDAERWGRRMLHNFLERNQLQTASYVYVSRQDQVDSHRWKQVLNEVISLNTRAQILQLDSLAQKIISLSQQATQNQPTQTCISV